MSHVATITIDHTKVPGDLTDYVGLIVPDGSAGYAALYALCLEGGGDIRLFKSDDTTEIAREIVTFSVTSETGEIHYKYSGTLSSSVDTDIHVYADGSSADYAVTATYGAEAVWGNYIGVYHQNQASSSTSIDSAGANDMAKTGSPTQVTGQIGNGQDYDGTGDYHEKTAATGATEIEPFFIQAWYNTDSVAAGAKGIALMGHDDSGEAGIIIVNDALWAFSQDSTFSTAATSGLSASTWYMAHGVFAASNNRKIYVDGVLGATDTTSVAVSTLTDGLRIGARFLTGSQDFNGKIDEVRFGAGDLSPNWITTEYNNQNSYSTFYSVAAVAGISAAQVARRGAVMMM